MGGRGEHSFTRLVTPDQVGLAEVVILERKTNKAKELACASREAAQHVTETLDGNGGEVLLTGTKVNKQIQNEPKSWKEVEKTRPPQELLLDHLERDRIIHSIF